MKLESIIKIMLTIVILLTIVSGGYSLYQLSQTNIAKVISR